MKQVFLKHGQVVVEEVPPPICTEKHLLVANRYSLISPGTESHFIQQASASLLAKAKEQPQLIKQGLRSIRDEGLLTTWDKIKQEKQKLASLGYCSSGVVLEVGRGVTGYSVGDRVACGGYGWASHSQLISVPEKLTVKLPPEVGHRAGAFTTLGSIALHAVHQAEAGLGDNVVVIGLGLIGLLAVQILRAAGCRVLGLDPDEARVELARKLGLHVGIWPAEDAVQQVVTYTHGQGADAVIICASTPSQQPLEQAAGMARKRGRIVIVGVVGMQLPREPFYEKELLLSISCSYGPGRYDPRYESQGIDYPLAYVRWTENRNMAEFVRLLAEEHILIDPLVSREHPLEEAAEAYRRIQQDKPRPLAVLLTYPPTESVSQPLKINLHPLQRTKGVNNIALIGCGNMAQAVHLPTIAAASGYRLAAVVSRTATRAKACAEKYRAAYFSTHYQQVLEDEDVETVLICTRHNLHAQQVIQAARAGKDILVEKPLALTYEDCRAVAKAVAAAKVHISVGYNRRHAPLTLKARELLAGLNGPLLINYRVNAGFFPPDHWIHDPVEGGGRILGEACHFFDFFNYLIQSRPIRFTAQAIPVDQQTVVARDNVVATLGYEDGSLGVLTYTSLGHAGLAKEYVEIYAHQHVIIIDDYKELWGYGFGAPVHHKLKKQDKGFHNQLVQFQRMRAGEKSDCPTLEEGILATHCALKVMECIDRASSPAGCID
jgi:predicted dehydrogenase